MTWAPLVLTLLGATPAPGNPVEHPALRRGLWVQLTPVDLSWAPQAVNPVSLVPWVVFTAGADAGAFSAGIGFGVRPLVRGVLVLVSPVARLQLATASSFTAVLFEFRLHAGLATESGFAAGGGVGAGADLFLSEHWSISPLLGVDLLGGNFGGTLPSSLAFVVSARVSLNFTW